MEEFAGRQLGQNRRAKSLPKLLDFEVRGIGRPPEHQKSPPASCALLWCSSRGAAMINAIRTPGRQYVNIHDISEELARDGTSTVEMLTMLVQAMWRGEFDGHMRVDGIELDSRDILSAA